MAYTDIDKPEDYFNTVTYSGNGSTQSITGVGFQPDWVWGKERTSISSHFIFDAVRGATKNLHTNTTAAETTPSPGGGLTSFDSDGFSASSWGAINESGQTYVAWNWKANGAGSSNTDGSITSSVSANTTAGFSIVSYTGTGSAGTVGTGLNAVPKVIIFKNRDAVRNWNVYHESLGTGKRMKLNDTAAEESSTTFIANTTPTSSVFSLSTSGDTNNSGDNIIAYCFAPKKGFSAMGQYTGNGNANGTFIYTGFKPAFLLVKPTVTADNWVLMDNTRDGGINGLSKDPLYPNKNFAEGTTDQVNFVSNGVKIINSGGTVNRSGEPFIYMCFAESPFTTSTGIPTTAR